MSVKIVPEMPSTLIRKGEFTPPARTIDEMTIAFLFLLCTLKLWVVDPTVAKTVSNITVSVVNSSLAEGSVIKASLRQEKMVNSTAATSKYLALESRKFRGLLVRGVSLSFVSFN